MSRRFLAAAGLSVAVALAPGARAQETIETLPGAHKQQEIEVLRPPMQQQVDAVEGGAQQDVRENVIPSPAKRRASAVGKVVVGVLAAAVAIAASAASLLLL